jgi:ribosome-associated protein
MIKITDQIAIDESEIEYDFVRASGPGGQHVNKAATAVQLRFDVASSSSLPKDVRQRLVRIAGNQISAEGVLIIEASRFRSQHRNRKDAMDRLVELIDRAARKPRVRRRTKPTRAAKERRLRAKRRRSEIKRMRQSSQERY